MFLCWGRQGLILFNFAIVKVAHRLCQKGWTLLNFAIVKVAPIVCRKDLAAFYCTAHARAGATLLLSESPFLFFVRFPPVFTVFALISTSIGHFWGRVKAITVMPVRTPKAVLVSLFIS